MPRMKKAVEGIHTTGEAEATAKEVAEKRPVKEPEKAPAAPMPTKVISYSELSPVIRKAIIDYHRKQGARPSWPNVLAAMRDCTVRMQRQWSQVLEEFAGGKGD